MYLGIRLCATIGLVLALTTSACDAIASERYSILLTNDSIEDYHVNQRKLSFRATFGLTPGIGIFHNLNANNPSLCEERTIFGVIPYINLYGYRNKFGLKLEHAFALPIIGLSYKLDTKYIEKNSLWLEVDLAIGSSYFEKFNVSKLGTGVGLNYHFPKWDFGFSYVLFKRPIEHCNGLNRGLASNWLRFNFSRRIFYR